MSSTATRSAGSVTGPLEPTLVDPATEYADEELVAEWLARFERSIAEGRPLRDLFEDGCHWRDAVALTGTIMTTSGATDVAKEIAQRARDADPSSFVLAGSPRPARKTRAGREVVEAFFDFRTRVGRGRGVVRLIPHADRPITAWTLLTTLQAPFGLEDPDRSPPPRGGRYGNAFGELGWGARREREQQYLAHDPDVLIIGGGQAGTTLGARLRTLGVDALIIDRNARPGDNWRKRYEALVLHNESWVCELPYMPFPPGWPVYVPKDMIAGWLETYIWAMELNYWASSELVSAAFDDASHRWEVVVRTDSVDRILHPSHLVLATGMSGSPKRPALPGLADFGGTVLHTSDFVGGAEWAGRRAIVVGTGNSGHDVAQDLHAHGAQVTMIQRSPTTITSVEPAAQLVFALYSEGHETGDADLLSVSMPYELMLKGQQILAGRMLELDRALIDALEGVGFRTDIGEDDSGYYMKYLRTGGGYYLNIGCSELIAQGEIAIVQAADVAKYTRSGLNLVDGGSLDADLIVLATGYENLQETTRRLIGDQVADRVGSVWGFDERGDARNVWKATAQEGLWYMAGSFAQCRTYSRFLGLQLWSAIGSPPSGGAASSAPSAD